MKMRAARMHGYKQPLRLEEIPVPTPGPEEVLVEVGGAGMCRTDFQLIDGYFDRGQDMGFPFTPGHEIAGWVDSIGSQVPASAGLSEGDQVVVYGGWVTARAVSVKVETSRSARRGTGSDSAGTAATRSTFPSITATSSPLRAAMD